MRTIRRSLLITAISTTLLLYACTEKVEIDLDSSKSRLVIEGRITNNLRYIPINITKTAGYFSQEPVEPVSGAEISIYWEAYELPFSERDSGYYVSLEPGRGVPGVVYTLEVTYEGKVYITEVTIPPEPFIDSIGLFYPHEGNIKEISVGVYGPENPVPGQYYLWKTYADGFLDTDTVTEISLASDKLINGQYFNGILVQDVEVQDGQEVTLSMVSISKEYFEFLKAVIKETKFNNSPFEAAPAPIEGNIDGVLGFFSGQNEVFASAVYSRISK